jgi:hypothetical protein
MCVRSRGSASRATQPGGDLLLPLWNFARRPLDRRMPRNLDRRRSLWHLLDRRLWYLDRGRTRLGRLRSRRLEWRRPRCLTRTRRVIRGWHGENLPIRLGLSSAPRQRHSPLLVLSLPAQHQRVGLGTVRAQHCGHRFSLRGASAMRVLREREAQRSEPVGRISARVLVPHHAGWRAVTSGDEFCRDIRASRDGHRR